MTTSSLQLPQPMKHRFDQAERTLRGLTPAFAPESIPRLQGTLPPAEERPLSASQMVVQRLRAERLARGWTQKQLAERAGIERANLARLEAGRHSPRVDTLESLANCLELSLAELFETARGAAELRELNRRQLRSGVERLKANLRVQRELGIIDESGHRTKRELPAEMLKGTSESV